MNVEQLKKKLYYCYETNYNCCSSCHSEWYYADYEGIGSGEPSVIEFAEGITSGCCKFSDWAQNEFNLGDEIDHL